MEQDTTTTPVQDPFPKVDIAKTSHAHLIGKGLIVGVIIFAIMFTVALYVTTSQMQPQAPVPPTHKALTETPDAATTALGTQSTSDNIADIEADVNATDLSSLNDTNKI